MRWIRPHFLSVIIFMCPVLCYSQCTSLFTLTVNADTLITSNQSSGTNLRTYWNFGDGSTSYDDSPVHIYPASGEYLVKLYIYDTILGCHDRAEQWINVTRPTSGLCQPWIDDTIINQNNTNYIVPTNLSVGCGEFCSWFDAGPAQNFSFGNQIILLNWSSALFLSRVQNYTCDTAQGYVLKSEAYKTRPYNFPDSLTYDSCSANFEYHVTYYPNNAYVQLRAMNPFAQSYRFVLIGMGNPVNLNAPETAFSYNYHSAEPYSLWLIGLYTTEFNGCSDTVWQQVLIHNLTYVPPPDCILDAELPTVHYVTVNSAATLSISTEPGTIKQWYMDDGTGQIALTNAGPFSGVNTDTLRIDPVSLSMNNYSFSCSVTNNQAGCGTSSADCRLVVSLPDINIYPNPAIDEITISFPQPDTVSIIKIYNAIGQLVMQREAIGAEQTIYIGALSSGIYILEVESRKILYRKKFIKQIN